jgi:2-methylcitrate dehydratase PrpD
MTAAQPDSSVAERIAGWLAGLEAERLPDQTVEISHKLFLDVAGLSVAARREPYVAAVIDTAAGAGPCTALGHAGGFSPFDAALINGTAAHGEDYDDTFEGGPVHSGAVVVPAALAACERDDLGGDRLVAGIAGGAELLCRLSLVAPKATHDAGFHPTAVFGTVAAAGAAAAALRLSPAATVSALGIAGSMASGIIEYLAEGAWTKRLHAGWAAQSGVRAALMARSGFVGPRTVFEGAHGLYRAFAPSVAPQFDQLLAGLGTDWVVQNIAFKPYACGTMTQPFIDCAIALAESGVTLDDIADIVCEVAAGTVPRLWEPLDLKHRPPNRYAAKFSTPFCMAVGFTDRRAGVAQFSESRIHDRAVLALSAKIRYVVNPRDDYPRNYSGHLRATLKDGTTREFRQPHLRGGMHEPLSAGDLMKKFTDNAAAGGWTRASAERFHRLTQELLALRRLDALAEFRS